MTPFAISVYLQRITLKIIRFVILILTLLASGQVWAQPSKPRASTATSSRAVSKDTTKFVLADSLLNKKGDLTNTAVRYAKDSVVFHVKKKLYHLYTDAKAQYGDVNLSADYIQLDWGKSEVFAHGTLDTSKKVGPPVKGKPIFQDREETYHMDTIRYNFKSKKAKIYSIATEQGEGYIHGKVVKKDEYDNLHLGNAKYTTCDLAEPHFHISAKKIMFINKKSALSGPFNIVVQDIPLPIGFFFGFFPVQPKQEMGTSGFVMGRYGEQRNDGRGFYFNDFGYYHAFNERFGSTTTFQVYSRGSVGLKQQFDYAKRYKYNGKFSFQYNKNVIANELGIDSLNSKNNQFEFVWSHAPKSLRTDRSFSSNMNMRSSGFAANNIQSYQVAQLMQNNVGGSINYMRNFGKLYTSTYSFSVNQNQNNLTSALSYSMGLKQFNPFVKEKDQKGRWYESFRVGLNVNGAVNATNTVTNRSSTYLDYNIAGVTNSPYTDEEKRRISELNLLIYDVTRTMEERNRFREELEALQNPRLKGLSEILKNSRITNSYSVPITLPNIKILKHINLTPSISMSGDLYDRSLSYTFVDKDSTITLSNGKKVTVKVIEKDTVTYQRDKDLLKVEMGANSGGVVVMDTVQGLNFANRMSFGASMNTRFYGIFRFGSKSNMRAIRHTVNPSLSFGYSPKNNFSTYQQVRSDGTQRYLPRYVGGAASSSRDAGNLSLSINNQLDAKVRSKSDTASADEQTIMLLDNFSIMTSYNIFAKKEFNEFALSNISLSTSTSLFKRKLNINAAATLDPYMYVIDNTVSTNKAGIRIPEFKWKKGSSEYNSQNVGSYLNTLTLGINTSLNPEVFKGAATTNIPPQSADPFNNIPLNPMDYVDFNIPWNLGLSYSFNYNKQGLARANITNTFSFNGDVSFTKNTKVTFSSGWDFRFNMFTLTSVGIARELHCWMFSLNWTPISGSSMRSGGFDFTLRPKANLLKDLKITRRRSGSY